MTRTYVVTGSASGMGKATAALLSSQCHRVITLDLRDADVNADLSTPEGREAGITGIKAIAGESIDAVVHCAGVAKYEPVTMSINFFGAVAMLEGLLPLLAKGTDPRAVAITSYAALMSPDPDMIQAALDGDEPRALALGEGKGVANYSSSKAALAQWCRAAAISPRWAGQGVLLNSVAPGMVETPMIAHRLATQEALDEFKRLMPLPVDRVGKPEELAQLLVFLASPENSYLVGQNIYADGGTEAVMRGKAHI